MARPSAPWDLQGSGKTHTPQVISEVVLAKLAADALAHLGEPVDLGGGTLNASV